MTSAAGAPPEGEKGGEVGGKEGGKRRLLATTITAVMAAREGPARHAAGLRRDARVSWDFACGQECCKFDRRRFRFFAPRCQKRCLEVVRKCPGRRCFGMFWRSAWPERTILTCNRLSSMSLIDWCVKERSRRSPGGRCQGQGDEGRGGTYHVCVCFALTFFF